MAEGEECIQTQHHERREVDPDLSVAGLKDTEKNLILPYFCSQLRLSQCVSLMAVALLVCK